MKKMSRGCFVAALALVVPGVCCLLSTSARAAEVCPPLGWQEQLANFQKPDAAFPTKDTATLPTPDCNFHEWSWEAFVWATALVTVPGSNAPVPRFLTLPTPDDLTKSFAEQPRGPRPLKLAARAQVYKDANGYTEGAGAIVEADGNMLVAQNGYPVYASVHMNDAYFSTAQRNLVVTGDYQKGSPTQTFPVGAAVFKAMWLRIDQGQTPPLNAYTTQAEVPVLQTTNAQGQVTIAPVPGQYTTVTVALIGLHVVGCTENHPEFLWGTFEHNQNSPATPDNTFSKSGSDPKSYTLYKGGTSFAQANQAIKPPKLALNATTQKLTPITNVVLENATGGENQTGGVANIQALNKSGQAFFTGEPMPQGTFRSYYLVGTVWMKPNTYNVNSGPADAVGSVTLANGTAETFFQVPKNSPLSQVQNCFTCHNAQSYSFQNPPPPQLVNRLVALSHVLGYGTAYAVPNSISGPQSLVPAAVAAPTPAK